MNVSCSRHHDGRVSDKPYNRPLPPDDIQEFDVFIITPPPAPSHPTLSRPCGHLDEYARKKRSAKLHKRRRQCCYLSQISQTLAWASIDRVWRAVECQTPTTWGYASSMRTTPTQRWRRTGRKTRCGRGACKSDKKVSHKDNVSTVQSRWASKNKLGSANPLSNSRLSFETTTYLLFRAM